MIFNTCNYIRPYVGPIRSRHLLFWGDTRWPSFTAVRWRGFAGELWRAAVVEPCSEGRVDHGSTTASLVVVVAWPTPTRGRNCTCLACTLHGRHSRSRLLCDWLAAFLPTVHVPMKRNRNQSIPTELCRQWHPRDPAYVLVSSITFRRFRHAWILTRGKYWKTDWRQWQLVLQVNKSYNIQLIGSHTNS